MKLLPISTLRSMTVEEQDKMARQAVGMETAAKNASDAHKQSFPAIGKVVCIIEERLNDLKSDRNKDGTEKKRQIASNTSLSTYWESITRLNGKSTKLNSHWYSCAVAFGTYVRSELIEESDYDKNTAQCLELAASISTAVGGDVTSGAVAAAAEELRDRSKDTAKHLQEILDTVKEPKAMTVEQAQKALAKIMACGHLPVVVASVGAEIAHLTDAEMARSTFFGMLTANDMWAANVDKNGKRVFPDKVLDAWQATYDKANTPGSETPETPAPAETPAPVAQAA